MWIEIFQQNRDEILKAVRSFQSEMQGFHDALAAKDWDGLRSRLEKGKTYRDGFPG